MTPKTNPVTWFEIYVEDLARAKAFYESVFNCSLIKEKTDIPNKSPTKNLLKLINPPSDWLWLILILGNGTSSARPKENSPTSGLLRFLVARGGIEPGPRMSDPIVSI